MNAKRLLSLWGLKWNPFSPELPSEGLLVTAEQHPPPLPVVRVAEIPHEDKA